MPHLPGGVPTACASWSEVWQHEHVFAKGKNITIS